jgi:alpha-galactosidase
MEAVRGGDLEVWVAELSGDRRAVALVNRSPLRASISAPWAKLGLVAAARMSVRDVWEAADKGEHTGKYSTEVNGKGVALLVLTPAGTGEDQ